MKTFTASVSKDTALFIERMAAVFEQTPGEFIEKILEQERDQELDTEDYATQLLIFETFDTLTKAERVLDRVKAHDKLPDKHKAIFGKVPGGWSLDWEATEATMGPD